MGYTKYRTNTYDNNGTIVGGEDNYKRYSAIISQTCSFEGSNINAFGGGLIIGEYYTIDSYASGDDFSNVAEVISGDINTTGCYFKATGMYPEEWSNDSNLISDGNLVVQELENTIGVDIIWDYASFGEGSAFVYADIPAPITVLGDIHTNITTSYPFDWPYMVPSFTSQVNPQYGVVEVLFTANDPYGSNEIWDCLAWRSSFEMKIYNPNPIFYGLNGSLSSGKTLNSTSVEPKIKSVRPRKDRSNYIPPTSGSTGFNLLKEAKSQIKNRAEFLQAIKKS